MPSSHGENAPVIFSFHIFSMKINYKKIFGRRAVATAVTIHLALVLIRNSSAATITGKIVDTEGFPTNATVAFSPLSTPLNSSGRIILTSPKTVIADTNGNFSITLEPGDYKITIGANVRDSFVISVPEGIATNDWTTLITSELTYCFPHSPVYEEKLNRGLANGYASLDSAGRVPLSQLGAGAYSSNTFLRGDGVWTNLSVASLAQGIISDSEFNCLDGVQQNIQEQLNQRLFSYNGVATNLVVHGLVSSAELSFLPGQQPQNPMNTVFWNDQSQKTMLIFQNNGVQSPTLLLFTSTNSVTCTNTTAETVIVPSGIGSLTLPANSIAPGKSILIRWRGIYSSPSLASTVILKFKIGDAIYATPALGYSTSQSNKPVYAECNISFISAGANGACILGGQFGSQTFTYVFCSATNPQNQTIAVDTTRDNQISVTATHSRADVSLTVNQFTVQTAF